MGIAIKNLQLSTEDLQKHRSNLKHSGQSASSLVVPMSNAVAPTQERSQSDSNLLRAKERSRTAPSNMISPLKAEGKKKEEGANTAQESLAKQSLSRKGSKNKIDLKGYRKEFSPQEVQLVEALKEFVRQRASQPLTSEE